MRDRPSVMFGDNTAHSFGGGNNLVLRTTLGPAPRPLDSYLGELADGSTDHSTSEETP
jgi:hypothetical protein